MDIRGAILKSAGLIERKPDIFNFFLQHVPDCGSPGCAIGLICAQLGAKAGLTVHSPEANALMQCDHAEFYGRMTTVSHKRARWWDGPNWTRSAEVAAEVLRLYADKYHPADEGQKDYVLPDWNALAMQPLPVAERASAHI